MNYSEKFGAASFQEISSPSLSQKDGFDFTTLGSSAQNIAHGSVIIDDAHLLFSGQYKRDGLNLVISNDEHRVIVPDYFKGDTRATLSTRDGAALSGKVVDALTGHVAYAQAGQADPPKEIGTVAKLTGTATAIRNGVSVQLNVGDKVYKSDVLESGGNSALGVTFIDGTVFSLSSNARMVLNEMVYDPNSSSNSSLLSLVQGTITFVAGQTAKNGNMRVDTPVATMGIRGTTVLVKINSADGRVQLSVERDPDGKVGSFVVYDRNTGQVIGTVTREGDKTIVTPSPTPTQPATTDSVQKTQAEKVADLIIVQQIFQQFFPDVKKDPNNANPGRQGNNGAGAVTPQTELANAQGQGTTTVSGLTFVVSTSGGSISPPVSATIISPPVIITPVSDFQAPDGKSTRFTIGGQVQPDPLIIPYIANSGRITGAETTAPTPGGFDLLALVQFDAVTGTVTYNPEDFRFLALGETATYEITFLAQTGPFTPTQTITFTVDGLKDAPIYTAGNFALPLTEPLGTGSATMFFKNGELRFNDADFSDVASGYTVRTTGVTTDGVINGLPNNAALLNMLSFTGITKAVGTTLGVITEKFSAAASVFDYLAQDEKVDLIYSIQVTDAGGDTNTSTLTVTITGTNDLPTITGATTPASTSGSVAEDGVLMASGVITFKDVDLSDTHTVSSALTDGSISDPLPGFNPATSMLGTLSVVVNEDAGDLNNVGTVSWTYTLDNMVAQKLAEGQTIIQTYTVTISDVNGATVTQPVIVTITGDNDDPTIVVDPVDVPGLGTGISTVDTGEVTEDQGVVAGVISANGVIVFQDVDLIDSHTASFVLKSSDANADLPGFDDVAPGYDSIGIFALNPVIENGADESDIGAVGWTFTLNNDNDILQSLAAGQTITLVYTVTIVDDNDAEIPQDVTIVIHGANDDPNDNAPPVIIVDQTNAIGAVIEGDSADALTDSGTITFQDIDLIDTHTIPGPLLVPTSVTVTNSQGQPQPLPGFTPGTTPAGYVGALTLTLVEDPGDPDNRGNVDWVFSVDDDDPRVQALAEGQTITQTYTVTITDTSGASATQNIVVTITGTNDAPIVASVDVTGGVTELETPAGNLTDSGTIAFTDVDLIDVHLVSATGTPIGMTLGSLTAVKDSDTTGDGSGGQLTWTYTVAASAVEYLAEGEEKIESFTITLDDQNGGMITRQIDVTITGTNDLPQFVAVAGDTQTVTITDTAMATADASFLGHYHYTDADLTDTHAGSATLTGSTNGTILGTLGGATNSEPAGATPGDAIWVYSVTGAKLDALGEGQTVTETGKLIVLDGTGQSFIPITVTLTGVNDTPVVTAASLVVSEGGTVAFTAANLGVTDPDNTSFTFTASATHGVFQTLQTTLDGDFWIDATSFTTADLAASHVRFVHDGGEAAPTFTIQADDGSTLNSASDLFAGSVSFTNVNDAPALDLDSTDAPGSGFDGTVENNGSLSAIADMPTLADVDDTVFDGVKIVLTDGLAGDFLVVFDGSEPGGESGELSNGVGWVITGTADDPDDPLTITFAGGSSAADYQFAIEQVMFGSDDGEAGPRHIEVTVNDGEADSNTAVATITVQEFDDGGNNAPIAGNDLVIIASSYSAFATSTAYNDIDLDGDTFQVSGAAYGSMPAIFEGGAYKIQGSYGTLLLYPVATSSITVGGFVDFSLSAGDYIYVIGADIDGNPLSNLSDIEDRQPGVQLTDTFAYTLADSNNAVSAPATITVTLDPAIVSANVVTPDGYNMTTLSSDLYDGIVDTIDNEDGVVLHSADGNHTIYVETKNLTFNDLDNNNYELTGGLIKGFTVVDTATGNVLFTADRYSIPATALHAALSGPNGSPAALDTIFKTYAYSISGNTGADVLDGGNLQDFIDTNGGADHVHAFGGNDLILVHDDNGWNIDGGAGIDTIRFVGEIHTGQMPPGSSASNIEIIDLNTTHADSLLIDGEGAAAVNDDSTLHVTGNAADTVNFVKSDSYPGFYWHHAALSNEDGYQLYEYTTGTSQSATVAASVYVQDGVGVNFAPVLNTSNFTVIDGDDGIATVVALSVSDPDANDQFTVTATAASPGSSVTKANGDALPTAPASLTDINALFANGVKYTPAGSPGTDMVTLTVTDSHGVSDQVNFVFNVTEPPANVPIVLTGTDGKDVLFATGYDDDFTGGEGRDQFVFTPESGMQSNADRILDFEDGLDKIDLRAFSSEVDAGNFTSWLADHATPANGDTLIEFDAGNSILVKNVANLQANDFILHPGTLVA